MTASMFTQLIEPTAATQETLGERPARERFLAVLASALASGQWRKLSLGRYRGEDKSLERVLGRPVMLRGVAHVQLVYRHSTQDITHNVPTSEALAVIDALVALKGFESAHLLSRSHEVQLTLKAKGGRDKSHLSMKAVPEDGAEDGQAGGKAEGDEAAAPASGHNREKVRPLTLQSPFWRDLGLSHGAVDAPQLVPAMARKWKQINKFVEIFQSALKASALDQDTVRVVDFGCGKGYLTFAMHEALRTMGRKPDVTGVELRPELVKLCNAAAEAHAMTGLHFDAGDVRTYTPLGLDVMVALHACDIATDFAIHLGLRARASIILCAPCCHKELRPQMHSPALLRPLLHHGIHLGQEAEMITDGLRALLLDAQGYDTQVFEFTTLEHTLKNKMILAVRRPQGPNSDQTAEIYRQIDAIKQFYGIRQQSLEGLLRLAD